MDSFVNRALAYLGLKDIDDEDEDYVDDYEAEYEGGTHRAARTAYPERETNADARIHSTGTIRPINGDDATSEMPNVRSAIVRPLVPRTTAAEVHVVAPSRFSDAQEIGDVVRQSNPVIVNLQMSERDLARRMIDFCSGLTYALNGSMRKVADQVFLLTPPNVDLPPEERQRLQERGLFRS